MNKELVLVINAGSSSLKYALYDTQSLKVLAEGIAESLGTPKARVKHNAIDSDSSSEIPNAKHDVALQNIIDFLDENYSLHEYLVGIGHRVVHGGENFSESVIINPEVKAAIQKCVPLAPLHNPANILGIEATQQLFENVPQVAVFDTAFHQTMPKHAFIYGLPYELYRDNSLRRYGFHGTSHRFILKRLAEINGSETHTLNVISAHLGNGASVCAIKNGISVDTSMGLTPLEGLVMGTRSGDIDPGIFDFLIASGKDPKEISTLLNKKSGLLGISEISNDMRTLQKLSEEGSTQASLAIDIFCYRLAKYIAAMQVALDDRPVLVFTGGIGENSPMVRSKVIDHLTNLNYGLNKEDNITSGKESNGRISDDKSTPIFVIPTDEELMIAQDTIELIKN